MDTGAFSTPPTVTPDGESPTNDVAHMLPFQIIVELPEPTRPRERRVEPFNVETLVLYAVQHTLQNGPLSGWQRFMRYMFGAPRVTTQTRMSMLALNPASYVHLLHIIVELLENVGIHTHVNITELRACRTVGDICSYVGRIVALRVVGGPYHKYVVVD